MNCLKLAAALAGIPLLLAGCAPEDAGFGAVSSELTQRTGYSTGWTRGIDEDALVDQMVSVLLSDELTLEEAVQIALVNNRALQASFEQLGINRGARAGMRALFASHPSLDDPVAEGAWWFFDKGTAFEGVLTEDVISIITIPMRRELEGNRFEATKLQVIAQTVHLVADVKRAWFTYQANKQMVEMFQHAVQATKGSYMAMERLREAGNTRQLDVFRERILYEEAKVALNQAVEQLARSRETLNSLMGLWGRQTRWETPQRLPAVPGKLAEMPLESPAGVAAITPGEFPQKGKMTARQPSSPPTEPQVQTRVERLAGPPVDEQIGGDPQQILGPQTEARQQRQSMEDARADAGPSAERFAEIEKQALAQSLDLAIAWRLVQAQAGRLKLDTTLAIFPFLEAGGTAERNPEGKWGAGPAVISPIPVFDFGQGQIPQETSRLRQRLEQYAAVATDIRAVARAAEARFQAARSRALYMGEVVMPLHAAFVAESQLQYNAMQLTAFQLIGAKVRQIRAGQQYVLALLDYWLTRTDLEQLLDGSLPPGVIVHGLTLPPGTPMGVQPNAPGM